MRHTAIPILATLLAPGCVVGHLREVDVDSLHAYRKIDKVQVDTPAARLGQPIADGVRTSLGHAGLTAPAGPAAALHLELHVLHDARPKSASSRTLAAAARLGSALGIGTRSTGELEVEADLLAPDGRTRLGHARWLGTGDPSLLAPQAASALGDALAHGITKHRGDVFQRYAADERLFLTPTAQTLAPGEVAISNDEVLLFRIAVGVSRHVQLDLWLGGLPLPVAGALPVPLPGGVEAAGAAAGMALGVADLGIKWRFLDETGTRPGLAISYDLLDAFGGAFAAGGILTGGGSGGSAVGIVGTTGGNMQLNLLSFTATKHFGPVAVNAGTYLLDNHHFLPQTVSASESCSSATSSGQNAADPSCNKSGTRPIAMLPDMLQPYLTASVALAPWVSLGAEILPRLPLGDTMVSTGARFRLGFDHAFGPLALDRIRLRLDISLLWERLPPAGGTSSIGMIPAFGVGLYFR